MTHDESTDDKLKGHLTNEIKLGFEPPLRLLLLKFSYPIWFQVLPVIWQEAWRGLGHMGCCWTCNSWWQTLAENLSSRKNNLLGCNSTHKLLYNSNILTVNGRLAIWRHRYCAAHFLINPWLTKLIGNVILTMQHFNCKNTTQGQILNSSTDDFLLSDFEYWQTRCATKCLTQSSMLISSRILTQR